MGTWWKLLATLFVIALFSASFSAAGFAPVGRGEPLTVFEIDNPLSPQRLLPFSSSNRFVDPALETTTGRVNIVIAVDASAPLDEFATVLRGMRALPAIGDVRLVAGLAEAATIAILKGSPFVYAILEDRPIGFSQPNKPSLTPNLPMKVNFRLPEVTIREREPLNRLPETSMRDVVNFTGARRAWTELGSDGSGVTIAVVDSGVDHGAFNLGNGSVARSATGVPISFDPDGSTLAWTSDSVTSYDDGLGDTFVTTGGTDPLIYIFDLFSVFGGGYGPKAEYFSTIFGDVFPADMMITGLPASMSGTYRFGVLFEWNFALDLFPVLLIDTKTAGVYDTAVLDLSFDYALWISGSFDYSFSDEPLLVPAGGNVVAARDMTGDEYPDISAGSMGYALDIWGLDPNPVNVYMTLEPLDPDGEFITMVYDWDGHGTSVAASAAGRESNHPIAGPGAGPGAKVMGVPIFAWFDIIEGWLWAAGFDLAGDTTSKSVPGYGTVYGTWTYTGNHKADIISNSWGISDWVSFPYVMQTPWYDVLTVVEDALMVPGYMHPTYPGTVMVHAGGNGAAGYGTMTGPGFNSLAITVGASTHLDFTAFSFGGFHNDVVSWSARGPNALGSLKPDLVQVGAFAYTAAPIWSGGGDGFFAYGLFGGTSQATPITSGSAAVVIDAYMAAHSGARPSPFVVKNILKSTSADLGYDPFVQGAGHVDVYNAAAYALGNAGLLATSRGTWDNVRPRVDPAWASAFNAYREHISVAPPAGPIPDTSWFAGSVRPGGSSSTAFTLAPARGTMNGTLAAVWHSRISSITLIGTTDVLGAGWAEGYGDLRPLLTPIPPATDLMVVRSAIPFAFLDSDGDYGLDNVSRIIIGDWVDDGDSVIDPAEFSIFNYGDNFGTISEARVGLPVGRFTGTPVLWLRHGFLTPDFVPMPYEIEVEFYDRVTWPWITVPSTYSASAVTPATLTATMAVPSGANPGVYEGQILVRPTGGNATAVPVSVVVPRVLNATTMSAPTTSAGSTQIYDASRVTGSFDWGWRYESGDWKLWFIDVADPNTIGLRVDLDWAGADTDIDMWSFTPGAVPTTSTFSPYLGSGTFEWSTTTGSTDDFVIIPTSAFFDRSGPGLYTIALHNVLLGAGSSVLGWEAIDGAASIATLTPRGPITVVTKPGRTVSIPLTLATGFDLNFVSFTTSSPSSFPATAVGSTDLLAAGESITLWANITVPPAPDGTYANYFGLGSDEVSANVRVNVVVDAASPGVSILSPNANAHVKQTVALQAAVSDLNNVASVTFAAGSASGPMTRDSTTGMWTAPWDTRGSADGPTTVTVTAVDVAGNAAISTRTVIVDNTVPAASIAAPLAGTSVKGVVTVSFTATDTNLLSATLSFGGSVVNVTGQSSAAVDTRLLADGPQTMTLVATDRALNTRTATVMVSVDNTMPLAVVTSPRSGAFLRGTATFTFTASDANVVSAVLEIGTASFNVAGRTSEAVITVSIADGAYTATLTVTDRAGNTATSSTPVTIDNTPPSVSILEPSADSRLRGSVTIRWSAAEANVDRVLLTIDGETRDLTGATSFVWDTTTIGDGSHTIEIRVVDKAGNERTDSIPVTTDNVAAAAAAANVAGLTIGLLLAVAAAVVGFVLGYVFRGRRKPDRPKSPEDILRELEKEL